MEDTTGSTGHRGTNAGDRANADPRDAFDDAAEGGPEVNSDGDHVNVNGNNAALNGIKGQRESEDDATYRKRIEAHIHELYVQEQEKRKREEHLREKIRKAYENNTLITLAQGIYKDGTLPGGNFKFNSRKGEFSTKVDLSKPPKTQAQKKRQNKKIAAMIEHAANGNMRHAVVMTRKPLFRMERKVKNPITGSKRLLPKKDPETGRISSPFTIKSSQFGGAMKENPELAQRFNEIADYLYKQGKISNPITFHSSEKELKQALEQEKEALKKEIGDPEEARQARENLAKQRSDWESVIGKTPNGDQTHSGDPEKQRRQRAPSMQA